MYGISAFAGDPGLAEIRCVIKRLFNDFIVVELPVGSATEEAEKVKPEPGEAEEESERKRPKLEEDETKEESIIGKVEEENGKAGQKDGGAEAENGEEHRDAEERPKRLAEEDFERIKSVAEDRVDECEIDLKEWPKEERKCLYDLIKREFGLSNIQTRCCDGLLTISRRSNNSERTKRSFWPKERGDFLHFTMTKRNMDSLGAIHLIAQKTRLRPSLFSISGIKDRRAITVQRVSAYRVLQQRLANLHLRDLWLSNFRYADNKLRLGCADGNRFSIILRDIDPSSIGGEQMMRERVTNWCRVGFLNYFGAQRFGTCGVDTSRIGHLMLSGQWEAATRALLAPRAEAKDSLNKCLELYARDGDATAALNALKANNVSSAFIEFRILVELAKCPNAHKAAILALSRDMRTMYIHAYQSLVFNKIVSRRQNQFGLSVLAGDLDCEGNLLTGEVNTEERGVCLPLPSLDDTKIPQNEVGKWYEEIAKEDGIQSDQFAKLGKEFALGSVYRPFIVRPANVQWKLLRYTDDAEPLQHCEFVPQASTGNARRIIAEAGEGGGTHQSNEKQKTALQICFDLPPGAYATVALRELMRTDFGKPAQKALEAELANGCRHQQHNSDGGGNGGRHKMEAGGECANCEASAEDGREEERSEENAKEENC